MSLIHALHEDTLLEVNGILIPIKDIQIVFAIKAKNMRILLTRIVRNNITIVTYKNYNCKLDKTVSMNRSYSKL